MHKFFTGLILWVVFAASFGTSVYYQNIGTQRVLKNTPFFDTWQLGGRSGELMKLLSLRYDMVMADFLWLRSIQSFGGRGMSNRDWRPIYNQFETLTDLDPYFASAYTFGNLVIGDEGGHMRPGLQLLEKGTFKVHRQYRAPFEAMYVAHWQMKDDDLARWFGRLASKRADAPDWINRMVAYIDVNSGQFYIGLDRFVGNLMQAVDADEPTLQDIALSKSAETIEKWNGDILNRALDEFTTQTGRLPNSINELLSMPALQEYEAADMSKLLASTIRHSQALSLRGLLPELAGKYAPPDPQVLALPVDAADGLEGKTMADFQDVVFQDSLTTVTGLPPSTTGQPYLINLTRVGHRDKFPVEEIFLPTNKLELEMKDMLTQLRSNISRRRAELGRNPESLREVFYTDFNTTEPFGGQWLYDPATGHVRSSSRPNF